MFSSLFVLTKEKTIWVVIVLGLAAGLVASYGRERHEGRSPDGNWWFIRFLIMPFLAIVASWGIDQFGLNPKQSALLAALLALLGYEVVRMFYARSKQTGEDLLGVAGDALVATAKPYFSKVESTPAGDAVAKIEHVDDPLHPRRTGVGRALRELYPTPADSAGVDDLLSRLDDATKGHDDGDGDDGKDPTVR